MKAKETWKKIYREMGWWMGGETEVNGHVGKTKSFHMALCNECDFGQKRKWMYQTFYAAATGARSGLPSLLIEGSLLSLDLPSDSNLCFLRSLSKASF